MLLDSLLHLLEHPLWLIGCYLVLLDSLALKHMDELLAVLGDLACEDSPLYLGVKEGFLGVLLLFLHGNKCLLHLGESLEGILIRRSVL